MKRLVYIAVLTVALVATAASIKVWGPGDVLSSTDLNANFAHIHNTMVGGHGPRLINADVASNAGIAHSKLAAPVLVPKAVATTVGVCTGAGACTLAVSSRFLSIVRGGSAGTYTATFSPALNNVGFVPILTTQECAGSPPCSCSYEPRIVGTEVNINCRDRTGTLVDVGFSLVVFDDND